MALFPPLPESPDEIRRALGPLRNDFSIGICTAGNAFAVGAIIRVAHSFLAREIVLIGSAPHYEKASMGMEKYESIVRVESDSEFLAHVGKRPLWAVEKDHATTSLYAIDAYPKDVVLLFGSERFGISKALLEAAEAVVGIPMYGVNHSFPLAISAGIVMNDWARRHYGGTR